MSLVRLLFVLLAESRVARPLRSMNARRRYFLVDGVLDAVFAPPPTHAELVGRGQ